MGVLAAVPMAVSFYQGGLVGCTNRFSSMSSRIGAATVSKWWSGSGLMVSVLHGSKAFFLWRLQTKRHLGCSLDHLFMEKFAFCNSCYSIRLRSIANIGRFAAGMSGIASFSLVLAKQIK